MALQDSPIYAKLTIDGVDITSYWKTGEGTKEYTEAIGACTLVLNINVSDVLDLSTLSGKDVTWQRGSVTATDYYKFRGVVVTKDIGPSVVTLQCKDRYYLAQKAYQTTSYDYLIDTEQGVMSAIYTDLINSYTPLTATPASVQDSGTTYILKKFFLKSSQIYERGDDLARGLNWQHYYNDYDDLNYFEPRGFIDTGLTLELGVNIVAPFTISEQSDKIVNYLTVNGTFQDVEYTEYFNGTNLNAQKYTLTYVPTSMKVYVGTGVYTPNTGLRPDNNDANLKTGGKVGSTSTVFNYQYDPDPLVKQVIFYDSALGAQPNFTPPVGTKNVEIAYTYQLNNPLVIYDQDSIDTYGLREFQIRKDDIQTVADAEVYANKYLDRFKNPFNTATIKVSGIDDIRTGRVYRIVDATKGLDTQLAVSQIKYFYPYKADEIQVGDDIMKMMDTETQLLDRVKRLEEQQATGNDLITQMFSFSSSETDENRDFALYKRYIAGSSLWDLSTWDNGNWDEAYTNNTFVLGNVNAGILGSAKLGDTGVTSVLTQLIPGDNTFKEFAYDTKYFDTGNSVGASMNTTTNIISIQTTAGTEVYYTNLMVYGVTYSNVKVTCQFTNFVYDPIIEISCDGKNTWQVVSNGVLAAIVNASELGTYLRIRPFSVSGWPTMFGSWGSAISGWPTQWGTWGNVGTNLKIQPLYNTDGSLKTPAIQVDFS